MKKLVLFILLFFWLAAGKIGLAQNASPAIPDQLDSLFSESLADPGSANLYEILYQTKRLLNRAKDYNFTYGNILVTEQGKNVCLISNSREHTQVFISNYLFKLQDFSIVFFMDDEKMVFATDKNGDGGYFKNDPTGHLVFNSLFMGGDKFRPMSAGEITYFNERTIRLLYLVKKAID